MTEAIRYLTTSENDKEKEDIISNMIIPITEKRSFVDNKLRILFNATQDWIAAEEKEIERLKSLL